ncbi:GPR endopeptidase [Tannockella kyphosi]|uniref:GPR endopeptidase n=1 Tax=Tannockella kyphosi TaxID=2899121 RepID=UPI002011278E|nr:GPR endopeptidase [Tannockella kyphosi]
MKEYMIRSDLANESLDELKENKHYQREEINQDGINIETFHILQEHPSISQKKGIYTEISFEDYHNSSISKQLTNTIKKLVGNNNPRIFIVGLGNQYLTSDAIGPRTLRDIRVTHYMEQLQRNENHYYDTLALIPGVTIQTGMESCDIIKSIVDQEKIDLVIVIDALCAKDYKKLCHVIQVNNVGIHPGHGIGNKRKAIDEKTIGAKVIAIGVPTVIYASSLVKQVIDTSYCYFGDQLKPENILKVGQRKKYEGELSNQQKELMFGQIGKLEGEKLEKLFQEILVPIGQNLVLSDKQIDEQCEIMSKIISEAINQLRC